MSSSNNGGQLQCNSSMEGAVETCHLSLDGDSGPTIAVRGSITLTSGGRYLPSVGANQSLSLPLSYGEPPPSVATLTYTPLSSATPTLSSLLNTPSLHCSNQLKGVNTSSSASSSSSSSSSSSPSSLSSAATCRTTPSHNNNLLTQPPLPTLNKSKNIVAANPLLAGKRLALFNKTTTTIYVGVKVVRHF